MERDWKEDILKGLVDPRMLPHRIEERVRDEETWSILKSTE
jgi:hypothetical protein